MFSAFNSSVLFLASVASSSALLIESVFTSWLFSAILSFVSDSLFFADSVNSSDFLSAASFSSLALSDSSSALAEACFSSSLAFSVALFLNSEIFCSLAFF
ncbi:hypothetical protein PY546_23630 [Providencia stuartii]|nr:hypothetical protein [Providencia stuartii]